MSLYLPLPERQPIRIHSSPFARTASNVIVAPRAHILLRLFLKFIRVRSHRRQFIFEEPLPIDIHLIFAIFAASFRMIRVRLNLRHRVKNGQMMVDLDRASNGSFVIV